MRNLKENALSAALWLITLAVLVVLTLGTPAPRTAHAQSGNAFGRKVPITTAATTTVLAQAGYLSIVTINGGTAGVVTLYDIAPAGCTGTPGSGKFATIEAISATAPVSLFYEVGVSNGLCIVTAAATDITVSVQ